MIHAMTKSSSPLRSRKTPKPHRRTRLGFWLVLLYYLRGFGDAMYYTGTTIVRRARNLRRVVRRGLRRFARSFLRVTRRWLAVASDKLVEASREAAAPFKKLGKSVRSLVVVIRSTKDRGFKYTMRRIRMFFKYGVLWNKPLVTRLLNYLLPAASLAVCLAVISSMLSLNYALQISYNGQTVGYVEDESVYDSARKIIQNRMISPMQQTWNSSAEMSIAAVGDDELVSQEQMAEALLSVSGEEIAQAVGLYIGGEFYGATTAGDLLADEIAAVLAPYEAFAATLGGDVSVKFAREVELVEGIFPVSSISTFDELRELVNSQEPRDIYFIAAGGESSAEVAAQNGISLDRLVELNGSVDNILPEGTTLLVAQGEPLLRVKTVSQEVSTQTVRYKQRIIQDDRFLVGYMLPVTTGELGERTTVSEVEYDGAGQVVSRTVISDEITKQPVDEEIIIGIRQEDGTTSNAVGDMNQLLAWPTGDYQFISRGFSDHHFALDIAGAFGTPIYAADNGVVTLSESIPWDYGTYIIIDHQNGMQTVYGHNSQNLVEVGDVVAKGQLIALMGSTGNSSGNHLHFETRWLGTKVDPEQYLDPADVYYR